VSETIVAVLLGIGVLGFAFTAVGLLFSRDLYNQIHYLAPGSIFGSLAFAAAAVLHEGFSQSGTKAILIALILLISNPVLSHATARAGRIRRNQQVLPTPHEDIPNAEELK
jgi:monovalent cation/proton antiporter MnhG/PhaG subunit